MPSHRTYSTLQICVGLLVIAIVQSIEIYSDFHKAAYEGNIEIIQKMMSDPESPVPVDQKYSIPAEKRSKSNCAGCKLNQNVEEGTTALHWAVKGKQAETVRFLLDNGADVNKQREDGWTALHYAANQGNYEIAKMLLDKGANTDLQMKEIQTTPINFASNKGFASIVELLISHGANVENAKNDGRTALYEASLQGHLPVVKVLIEKGKADYLRAGEDGSNCFHAAVIKGHYDVVKYYIENVKVDVTVRRNEKATALHDAAVFGFVDILKLIIDSYPREEGEEHPNPNLLIKFIDHPTIDGVTALAAGFSKGNVEVVKLLLDHGAASTTHRGQFTVLQRATAEGMEDMVDMLNRLANKPIEKWDVDDVAYFISQTAQNTKIPRSYVFLFRWNNINGDQLSTMSDDTFQRIGIKDINHIKVIRDAVKKATELSIVDFVLKSLIDLRSGIIDMIFGK